MKDARDSCVGNSHAISFQDCGQDIIHLATNYASDYLDYVENLPFDLQRSVTKLREVDQKCQECLKEMEQLYQNFKKELEGAQGIARRSYLLQIRRLFAVCKELGDEKLSIVQSISEAIESRNKQLEHGCRRFKYAYEPNVKMDHSKKEKDSKSDTARGSKRSRRQRNTNSSEAKDKNSNSFVKDCDKPAKVSNDDADEPPAKVFLSSGSSDNFSASLSAPALTRAALREEDKRLKDKKDEKQARDADHTSTVTNSGKVPADATTGISSSTAVMSSTAGSASASKTKSALSVTSSSATTKINTKGKKKKRKSNKIEKQTSASGEASPIIDMPIDPDEPTYCICQQVSFGQMIGCDNLKCPIEWFHFSCVRLTHKPKGKWYCPDCTIKRKRDGKKV